MTGIEAINRCIQIVKEHDAFEVVANKPVDVRVRDQMKQLLNWIVTEAIVAKLNELRSAEMARNGSEK